MKVYSAIPKVLSQRGVDTIFGIMGDSNMQSLSHFISDHGGKYVAATHECGAVSMASAYSCVSGKPGVASVTHGPALTNTITALVEAVRKRSKLLLISGSTPSRRAALQEFDVRSVASFVGANFERAYNADDAIFATDRAFRRVVTERLPVLLDLPADFMQSEIPDDFVLSEQPSLSTVTGNATDLDNALGLIASAKSPVILAGRGAVESGALDVLIELADLLGAPIATTLLAKDCFRKQSLNLGICGTLSSEVASAAIGAADCIIAFGASLNHYTAGMAGYMGMTYTGSLLDGKRIVQCDIDPARIGAFTPVTVPIVGDATVTALEMIKALRDFGFTSKQNNSNLQKSLVDESLASYFVDRSTDETVDPRSAMAHLDEMLPEERILVTDAGRHLSHVWKIMHVADPNCFVPTQHFGSIGLGLSSAIGAAFARPELTTVAVLGDGGFMMNMAEFSTAVQNKLRLVVVIINDGAYGAEYQALKRRDLDVTPSLMDWPEFSLVAEAMGGHGVAIRSLKDLDAAQDLITSVKTPLVIDLKVDPALDPRS